MAAYLGFALGVGLKFGGRVRGGGLDVGGMIGGVGVAESEGPEDG